MRAMTPSRLSMSSAGALFSSYDGGVGYDEMFDAAGPPRPHCRRAVRRAPGRVGGRAAPAPGRGRQGVPDPGHHLHRLRRRTRAPSGSSPSTCCRASSPPREWRTLERGLTQRLTAHQPVPQGRLPRGPDPRRRRRARASWSTAASTTAARCAASHVHRDIYVSVAGTDLVRLAGRPVRRARGQPARAERRVLHAGEPRGHQARASRVSSTATTSARSSTTARRCWRRCGRWRRRTSPIRRSSC